MLWSIAASAQQTFTLTLAAQHAAVRRPEQPLQPADHRGRRQRPYTFTVKPGDRCRSGITLQRQRPAAAARRRGELLHVHASRRPITAAAARLSALHVQRRRRRAASPSARASLPNGTQGVGLQPDHHHAAAAAAATCSPSAPARCRRVCRSIPAAGHQRHADRRRHVQLHGVMRIDSDGNTGTQAYTRQHHRPDHRQSRDACRTARSARPTTRPSAPAAAPAPYTFAVTAGALPTGLSLNASTGAITGTPSAAGTSASRSRRPMPAATPATAPTT